MVDWSPVTSATSPSVLRLGPGQVPQFARLYCRRPRCLDALVPEMYHLRAPRLPYLGRGTRRLLAIVRPSAGPRLAYRRLASSYVQLGMRPVPTARRFVSDPTIALLLARLHNDVRTFRRRGHVSRYLHAGCWRRSVPSPAGGPTCSPGPGAARTMHFGPRASSTPPYSLMGLLAWGDDVLLLLVCGEDTRSRRRRVAVGDPCGSVLLVMTA